MILRDQRSLRIAERLGDIWEQNYLMNRKAIMRSLQGLPQMNGAPLPPNIDGTPILVIGAGPSLKKNIRDIEPGLYNIAACDKACPLLADLGINPNLVFALNSEPTDAPVWLNKVISSECSELVVPCGVHPDTYSGWKGTIRFINAVTASGLHQRVLHELSMIPVSIGSNVGTFAYTMCAYWRANPIAYIGMDFSFLTRSEVMSRYDADGCGPNAYNILEMTDVNGEVRFLDLGWFDMAEAFQERVQMMKDWYSTRTINCTEGGINYSDAVEAMSLKEFNEYCRVNFNDH